MTSAASSTSSGAASRDMRIALVGCGKMGEAVLKGWLASESAPADVLSPNSFVVVSPRDEHRRELVERYGVATVASASELASAGPFDMVVLAVKPQMMDGVLRELSECFGGAGAAAAAVDSDVSDSAAHAAAAPTLYVTIAAGIPTGRYEGALPGEAHVVRVMPNMPLQVGMGASVVAGGKHAADDEVELVNSLFSALGVSHVVPESQIDAVGAISGSGPAYVAYMVEALRDAGAAFGLDADLAESLALETVGGTYAAMKAQGTSPEDMRISVCSPGGTTLAALATMDEAGFKPLFKAGVEAAVRRSQELGGTAK